MSLHDDLRIIRRALSDYVPSHVYYGEGGVAVAYDRVEDAIEGGSNDCSERIRAAQNALDDAAHKTSAFSVNLFGHEMTNVKSVLQDIDTIRKRLDGR